MSIPDHQILDWIREGDRRGWAELYQSVRPSVVAHIIKNSGSEAEAKDVFQDAIIDFQEKLSQGRLVLTVKIKTYLIEMCNRKWLKKLRNRKSSLEIRLTQDMQIADDGFESDEYEREHSERQRVVEECISQLGSNCKTVIYSFYYERMNMKQIAAKAGLANADVAKNTKGKCMRKLEECVKQKV